MGENKHESHVGIYVNIYETLETKLTLQMNM